MMTEEALEGTPSFLHKEKVLPLIQVLDDLYSITFFRFIRSHRQLGITSLGNSLNFALRYWNEYVDVDTTLWPQFIDGRMSIRIYDGTRTNVTKKERRMFEERLQQYQLSDQGIVIMRSTTDTIDTFNFSSIKYQHDSLNKLLQNLPNLQNYCDFFIQEMDEILKDSQNYTKPAVPSQNMLLPLDPAYPLNTKKREKVQYNNPYTNRFIQEKLSPLRRAKLTPAEAQCLYWLVRGKTAEETAIILQRSRRTIECHLSAIRTKLGCYKSSAVIVKAEKLGFIRGDHVFTEPTLW